MAIVTINLGTSGVKIGMFTGESNALQEIVRESIVCQPHEVVSQVKQLIENHQLSEVSFGIRVVHAGWKLTETTKIDSDVITYLESIQSLAPLHNPISLQVIQSLVAAFPETAIYAVFDTVFHHTMPPVASTYAIPSDLTEKYQLKRYGFHGLAYQSIVRLLAKELVKSEDEVTCIALQLGSGCSICAIQHGKSVDTSMGFSPLEGLISRTRTGDIDPTILTFLANETKLTHAEILTKFNTDSGLAGVSRTSGHLQDVLAAQTDASKLAFQQFIYRIQKYIGSYQAMIGLHCPIVLSGGMSEHSRELWEAIFTNKHFGVDLSVVTPDLLTKPLAKISRDESKRHVYVAFVDEEWEIALEVVKNCH